MFLLLFLQLAFADAIMGPPNGCPRGARGTSSHAGQWCEPAICGIGNRTCKDDDTRCGTQKLCVERETDVPCGGMEPDCTFDRSVAHGTCESDSDCEEGSCEELSVCVPKRSILCSTTALPIPIGLSLLLLATMRRRDRTRAKALRTER